MERTEPHSSNRDRDDAVVEVLLAPGQGSFVDALLALADDVANSNGPDQAGRAISSGFQAAVAQRMRRSIRGEGGQRSAA